MARLKELISIFEEARRLLAEPDNEFAWSSWNDSDDALDEIDGILSSLRLGIRPDELTMRVLFAPTGPIQEVSLSSGWGDDFIELANRFDEAVSSEGSRAKGDQHPSASQSCACLAGESNRLNVFKDLGLDSRFAEVSVLVCGDCGQYWLRYFYEAEAFTGSGRWYLGAVTPGQVAALTVEHARTTLEALDWYFYGGSYYDGRRGRSSGKTTLNP
jgi:hypothetical protein